MSIAKSTKSTNASAGAVGSEAEGATAAVAERLETAVKAGTELASEGVAQAVSMTKDHVDAAAKASSDAFKGYEEIVEFNKDNFEALVKAGTIVVHGVQALSSHLASLTQESFDDTVAASKSLIGARTLKELVDVSSSLAKANFEKMVSEGTKLSQMSTKLAEEAFAPLNSRVDAAVQRLNRSGP
jgi:phasin family protein